MTVDTAIALCAIVLALLWPTHQQLSIRALRRSMRRMRDAQRQHARALVHLQTTMAGQPAQVHAPMATVTKVTATISGDRSLQPHTTNDRQSYAQGTPGTSAYVCPPAVVRSGPAAQVDPDQTLRLGPPPSLARIGELCHAAGLNPPRESLARIAAIEQHLAGGRPTTRMELARALNLQPWEISADLHTAILARIVTTTSGHHTAGEAAYTLPDPTIRMARMPLLPGAA